MGISRYAAHPTRSPVNNSRVRRRRSQRQQWRYAVSLSFCFVLALILCVAIVRYAASYLGSHDASGGSIFLSSANEQRLGKITVERGDEKCEQLAFDNYTGQIISGSKPCVSSVPRDRGVPIPAGTMHRLDAISKSFSGR
jgi:hypothetical protein